MSQLLKSLIENCEIGLHKDAKGWRLSAKGPLALVALVTIIFLYFYFR